MGVHRHVTVDIYTKVTDKDIAGAPYNIRQKKTNKRTEALTVSSRGQTTVILCSTITIANCQTTTEKVVFSLLHIGVITPIRPVSQFLQKSSSSSTCLTWPKECQLLQLAHKEFHKKKKTRIIN